MVRQSRSATAPKTDKHLPGAVALSPPNAGTHAVLTPAIKLFSFLVHNCEFATAMNRNINICVSQCS